MPTIGVEETVLQKGFSENYKGVPSGFEEWFSNLCFRFGIELDEVTSAFEMAKKNRQCDDDQLSHLSKSRVYRIEIPANRYDLLSYEGLSIALKSFLTKSPMPNISVLTPKERWRIEVDCPAGVRPYVVGSILRGVHFTTASYESFIDLQDKLHHNLCRRRRLSAIGTHDLSRMAPSHVVKYVEKDPSTIRFRSLVGEKEVTGAEVLEECRRHLQLRAYVPILDEYVTKCGKVPFILDSAESVMSLPPLINSYGTRLTMDTRDVFIECTGEDMKKAEAALNVLIYSFSQYSATPFTVEPVDVIYREAGHETKLTYPTVAWSEFEASLSRLTAAINTDRLSYDDAAQYLLSMGLKANGIKGDIMRIAVPPWRTDIMHECDIVEDVCIAFGYDNIRMEYPSMDCQPRLQAITRLSDFIRADLAMAGYVESLNWALLSTSECVDYMRVPRETSNYVAKCVSVSNPKTSDFEVLRTSLIPCLLKTVGSNRHAQPPFKLFEVGDVVFRDSASDTGASNVRMCAVLQAGATSGFSETHGCLDRLMCALGVKTGSYSLSPCKDAPFLFDGLSAEVSVQTSDGKSDVVARMGVVHPETLAHFGVPFATSVLELNLQYFVDFLSGVHGGHKAH